MSETRSEAGGWDDLTPEAALGDSPYFRASLQTVEDEVEQAGKWLDAFIKNTNLEGLAEQVAGLEHNLSTLNDIPFIDVDRLGRASNTIGTILEFSDSLLAKMITNMEKKMVGPLLQNNLESVREIKEIRRHYEKMVEKYDTLLNRSERLGGGKDTIREEARLSDTLEYIVKLRQFKSAFELGLLDKIAIGMGSFGEYCWALGQQFKSLETDLNHLRTLMPEWQDAAAIELAKLRQPVRRPSGLTILDQTNRGVRSGHLFRKSAKSIKSSWKRVYAQLDGVDFSLTATSRQRGRVQTLAKTNVLLCEMRSVEVPDRRNCFEVYTSQKSWIFQAESEEDMRDWIKAFEAAKSSAVKPTSEMQQFEAYEEEETLTGLSANVLASQIAARSEAPNASRSSQNLVAEYGLVKENELLHRLLPHVTTEELVLGTFAALMRITCERYVSGRVYLMATALHMIPASLCPSEEVDALSIPYEVVTSIEPVVGGGQDRLLGQVLIKLREQTSQDLPGEGPDRVIALMAIEQISLDILIKLFRNSQQKVPKTPNVLLQELGIALPSNRSLGEAGSSKAAAQTINEVMEGEEAEVSCGCKEHLDKVEASLLVPMSAKELFQLTVSDETFIQDIFTERKYTEVEMGEWKAGTDGRLERTVKFNIPINNPLLKAKDTVCYERNLQLINDPGNRYVLDTEARTPQAPYGDTFITKSRLCIARAGPKKSRLILSIGIEWIKSPLVRSIIRDATYKGFARYVAVFMAHLRAEVAKRKAGASEGAIGEETLAAEEDLLPLTVEGEEAEAEEATGLIGTLQGYLDIGSELLGDIFRLTIVRPLKDVFFRFPLFALSPLILGSLLFSAFMWYRVWLWLSHPADNPLANYLDSVRSYRYRQPAQWHVPRYQHAHGALERARMDVRLLKEELLNVAKHINALEADVNDAQYLTWLADQLTACYQTSRSIKSCIDLERNWSHLSQHVIAEQEPS